MHVIRSSERGSVMVMMAIFLPLLFMFAAFAIDVPHWFDYSRNLQNRADAAALAAGAQLSTCLGATPATAAQMDAVGMTAQQYGGAPNGSSDLNLPYPFANVATYYNQPNLTSASASDFHLLLNADRNWGDGGTNWSLGSICNASDPSDAAACPVASFPTGCPMVDVRLTQANVPMFIKIFGFHPNIDAHARVQLQGVGGEFATGPFAVPDPGQAQCLVARVVDETSSSVLSQFSLTKVANSSPPVWTGAMSSGLSMSGVTAGDVLGVQAVFPADCASPFGGGDVYDDDPNGSGAGAGLVFVNSYKPLPATVTQPTAGSVWITPRGACDQYFFKSTSGCDVRVHAQVDFQSGGTPGVAISDGGAYAAMTKDAVVGGHQEWYYDTTAGGRGRTGFALSAYRGTGVCSTLADATKNQCKLSGDPLQASFGAFNDGTGTDDSGPIVEAHVGCVAGGGCPSIGGFATDGATSGVDSIPVSGGGSSPQLQVSFTLQGLTEAQPADPAVVLRSSVQSSKRTGAFDCGQGGGASALHDIIVDGCSKQLITWTSPPGCLVLPASSISCVQPVTGNVRNQVSGAMSDRIGATACNEWAPYAAGNGPLPSGDDPRAIPVAITSPADLATGINNPSGLIHILGFATFYVTGWDGAPASFAPCAPVGGTATNLNEPYPYGSSSNNNKVWGHFVQYLQPNAIPNGQQCTPTLFGDCVPVLTR